MLGFLIRLLPFWVREPLLIVIGSVLGVRLMYLAATGHGLVAAGFGLAFLVFTAIRVHGVVQALRARRNTNPAASAGGATADVAVPAQAQPQAAMSQAQAQAQALSQAEAQSLAGTGPRPGAGAPK